MKALLMPMTLVGLLFVSDAFFPNAVNAHPQSAPILYTIPVTDERGVVTQQFVVVRRDATNQFVPRFQQGQQSSLTSQLPPTRFPSRTFTTQLNSHTVSHRSPSVIFPDTHSSSHNPQHSRSFSSEEHRTTTVVKQTPHTSAVLRDEIPTTTTRRPQTQRNSGFIGTLISKPSILQQTNGSPSTGQGPTTTQPANKPSVKEDTKFKAVPLASAQGHSQSRPQASPNPSSFAQGHRQSSPQAPPNPSSFAQGHSQSSSQAPLNPSSFGQGHSQSSPQAPHNPSSFDQGHRQFSPQAPPNPSNFDQGHRQSSPQTPSNPSSFGQGGHRQSSPQAPPNPSSFGQGNSQSSPQAPPNTSSFGQGHSQFSPQAPPNPPSFGQGHSQSRPQAPGSSTSFGQGHIPATKGDDNTHSRFTPGGKPSFPDPQAHLRHHLCYSPIDYGTCRAALPRYYFDQKTGTCNCFLYGGCRDGGEGEGPNSFFTLEQCQHACHPPRKEEGPVCKDIFHDEHFVSFLDNTPAPHPAVKKVNEKSDKEFLESFGKV